MDNLIQSCYDQIGMVTTLVTHGIFAMSNWFVEDFH